MDVQRMKLFENQLFQWEDRLVDLENEISLIENQFQLDLATYTQAEDNIGQIERLLDAFEDAVMQHENNKTKNPSIYYQNIDEIKLLSRKIEDFQYKFEDSRAKLFNDEQISVLEAANLISNSSARFNRIVTTIQENQ
ncbi:hypothetical protein TVAG_113540 [Trichomonas vaginalis G3]|uniref:Uncharacterized protein n=1 Tax=Trichomonas vaginalis (strain ATCC PRA-98 / G3) TaxID=412133 RepID=A2DNK7_TRIV3|nr:tropomyosin family [Trichomonas vaginalis G3]EAY18010.1 hypothetical protein TVAG_113540 [Trichomonas vaginalis G3]KAI5524431.1 tropomyosin family [Trichomonas vaginalis G3]|eukprot:XP_001578996.1 hypothetical protein [Trichomonas vaginalis G3]